MTDNIATSGLKGSYTLVFGSIVFEAPVSLYAPVIGGDVRLGAFTYCNYGCEMGDVAIGRYCSIGQRVLLAPGEHPTTLLTTHPLASDASGITAGMHNLPEFTAISCTGLANRGKGRTGPTIIGHDVWIGANAVVLRGVTVGSGAIIAAGAVVTRNVEPFSIVGGVPAKPFGTRFEPALCRRILDIGWWDYDLSVLPVRDYSDIAGMLDRLEGLRDAGTLPAYEPKVARIGV